MPAKALNLLVLISLAVLHLAVCSFPKDGYGYQSAHAGKPQPWEYWETFYEPERSPDYGFQAPEIESHANRQSEVRDADAQAVAQVREESSKRVAPKVKPEFEISFYEIHRPEQYLQHISYGVPEDASANLNSKIRIPYLSSTEGFIKNDGNSQFHALSYILKNKGDHIKIRASIVQWLQNNRDFDKSIEDPPAYIARMRQRGNEGDYVTLRVASRIYGRSFIVLTLNSKSPKTRPFFTKLGESRESSPGFLLMNNHYELLFRE